MIVLDTNVISELMRARPDPAVFAWVEAQPRQSLCTTTVVQAEILYGIACLPPGRQRDALAAQAQAVFEVELAGRVLPFTGEAARCFAEIAAGRRRAGRPARHLDALIAACALAAGAAVATRDTGGFGECGVAVVNPWEAA